MANGYDVVGDPPNQITINWSYDQYGNVVTTLSGTVSVNPGGNVKFDIDPSNFPTIGGQLQNVCNVQVTFVSWGYVAPDVATGGGTIKVGS